MPYFRGMGRKIGIFHSESPEAFRPRLMQWLQGFPYACLLETHRQPVACKISPYSWIAAADAEEVLISNENSLEQLQNAINRSGDWYFGALGYDLKNEIEQLKSGNPDAIHFPNLLFFRPRHVLLGRHNGDIEIHSLDDAGSIWSAINAAEISADKQPESALAIEPQFAEAEYLQAVNYIRNHIAEGDVYELNLCMNFLVKECRISSLALYKALSAISPAPFATWMQLGDWAMAGASPERFLCRQGSKIWSQPIKGTARRGADEAEDMLMKAQLLGSEKERAENVMIVDLVRNDLSKVCKPGTVQVDELFGIYAFPSVHQMISTISATLNPGITVADIFKAMFPMGSMTGAPKIMAMQLIEQYERSRRGLYSGAAGYISPQQDMDFNVVIRSMVKHEPSQTLSFG